MFFAFGFLASWLLGLASWLGVLAFWFLGWLFGFLLVYAAFGGFGFSYQLLSQFLSGGFWPYLNHYFFEHHGAGCRPPPTPPLLFRFFALIELHPYLEASTSIRWANLCPSSTASHFQGNALATMMIKARACRKIHERFCSVLGVAQRSSPPPPPRFPFFFFWGGGVVLFSPLFSGSWGFPGRKGETRSWEAPGESRCASRKREGSFFWRKMLSSMWGKFRNSPPLCNRRHWYGKASTKYIQLFVRLGVLDYITWVQSAEGLEPVFNLHTMHYWRVLWKTTVIWKGNSDHPDPGCITNDHPRQRCGLENPSSWVIYDGLVPGSSASFDWPLQGPGFD